jgi:hypothetical protein
VDHYESLFAVTDVWKFMGNAVLLTHNLQTLFLCLSSIQKYYSVDFQYYMGLTRY